MKESQEGPDGRRSGLGAQCRRGVLESECLFFHHYAQGEGELGENNLLAVTEAFFHKETKKATALKWKLSRLGRS